MKKKNKLFLSKASERDAISFGKIKKVEKLFDRKKKLSLFHILIIISKIYKNFKRHSHFNDKYLFKLTRSQIICLRKANNLKET